MKSLTWQDVKNGGILPLSLDNNATYALIGPWVNVTHELQGIYAGPAPLLDLTPPGVDHTLESEAKDHRPVHQSKWLSLTFG